MKAFYYYTRDSKNRPFATHCFVTDGKTYARGTAMCSVSDNPNKKIGKRIAYSRAMHAFYRQVDLVGDDVKMRGSFMKCAFMPKLRPIECKLLGIVTP